jgi:ankyrin repeat protein
MVFAIFCSACSLFNKSDKSPLNEKEQQQFLTSIHFRNYEGIVAAVEKGADVNVLLNFSGIATEFSSRDKNPAAIILSEFGNDKLFNYLISQGSDPNYMSDGDLTYLMCFAGDIEQSQFLLDQGAEINKEKKSMLDGEKGYTALDNLLSHSHYLDDQKNLAAVEFLLENGARLNDTSLQAVIGDSSSGDNYVMTQHVLKKLQDSGQRYEIDPILEAVIDGESEEVVSLIKTQGLPKDKTLQSKILYHSIAFGSVETVELILEQTDIEEDYQDAAGNTHLRIAAGYNDQKMIEFFYNRHPNKLEKRNSASLTALGMALVRSKFDNAEYLLSIGAEFKFPNDLLSNVVAVNNMEALQFMLDHGYQMTDERAFNAMGAAIDSYQLGMLKYFVEQGYSVNFKPEDVDDDSLLAASCLYPSAKEEIVEYLLQQGADPDGAYGRGDPLNDAVCAQNLEISKLLVDYGADVNLEVLFFDGSTAGIPLYNAIMFGELDIVKLLVENGATVDDKVLDYAREQAEFFGAIRIYDYLESAKK